MDKKFIGNGLEISDLDTIAKIIKDNGLERIKIKNDDFELVIESKRKNASVPAMQMMGVPAMASSPTAMPVSAEESQCKSSVTGNVVKAPIVGTYYSSPSPNDKPFVSVGQQVKKGDTIFIIESMKVMSEVQSEFDGTIKEICVGNGDAVEFDQSVMVIG